MSGSVQVKMQSPLNIPTFIVSGTTPRLANLRNWVVEIGALDLPNSAMTEARPCPAGEK